MAQTQKLNATACTLLGFLHDRPMTGWELSEVVAMTIGKFWNVTRSQVYRELKTLESGGQVVGGERGVRDKRAYEITEAGRIAFADWIRQEPGPEVARYPMLVTTWFSDHLPPGEFEWFLSLHRARHEKQLRFLRGLLATVEDHSTPAARAARFGLFYEEAVMRWFDSLSFFGGEEADGGAEEPRPSVPMHPGEFEQKQAAGQTPRALQPKAKRSRKKATPATKAKPKKKSTRRRSV